MAIARTASERGLHPDSARKRRITARIGDYLVDVWLRVALSVAVGLRAIWRIFLLRTWRPTVRQEFVRHSWQVSIKALPTTILTAMIIGFALLFQLIYLRRGEFGEVISVLNINTLVLLTLVREIAPLLVGLIITGRSATVMISELVDHRTGGQIHMLDAQGIDVFDYLVVSRISALAVCSFALSVIFLLMALLAGFLMAAIVGILQFGFFEYMVTAMRLLTPAEYLILPLKAVSIGTVVGVIACVTALRPTKVGADVRELLPLGYMRAVVTTLIVSGVITAVVVW